jgi:hypothetical protein
LSKSNNDSKLNKYYVLYCKNLTLTIKETKRKWYNNQTLTTNNKKQTIWEIIETGSNKQNKSEDGICFVRKIMKECAAKKLPIPLTNVSIKANTINFNLKRLQQYKQRQLLVLCNNYLKVHSQIQNLKTCRLRKKKILLNHYMGKTHLDMTKFQHYY